MSRDIRAAIEDASSLPCASCGEPLGRYWREVYNDATDRMYKVHIDCALPVPQETQK